MNTFILAGGLGTRLSEESIVRPKPLVEIGDQPMLWDIMNIYAHYGFQEFEVASGYKGIVIKDYILGFNAMTSDLSVDLKAGKTTIHEGRHPKWKIHPVNTGASTMTGGR